MNCRKLFLLLAALACFGCGSDDPKTIDRGPERDAKPNESATSAANRSAPGDPSQDRTGLSSDLDMDESQYVSFPSAGIRLIRPEGFEDAENFHGFQQEKTQSSLMVVKMPGPFAEVTEGFNARQLQSRGMTLKSKDDVNFDGNPGILLGVTQRAYGTEYAKWIVAFGNDKETNIITANFPKQFEAEVSQSLKDVLVSLKVDNTPPPAPGADVGFTITASDKLKVAGAPGKSLLYTKDGTVPQGSPQDPIFIAAPSLSKVPTDNRRQFAIQRLCQTALTKITSMTSNDEVTIDGLDGFEILADAEDADSGTPVTVYQVILFDEQTYFLMQGIVGTEIREQYISEFKAMAHSLKRGMSE